MAGHAFDQHDRAVELGRARAAAERVALDLLFVAVEQRGELAGVRAAGRRRLAPLVGVERLQAVQQRGVERERRPRSPAARPRSARRRRRSPCRGRRRSHRHFRPASSICVDRGAREAAVASSGRPSDHRFGHGHAECRARRFRRCDAQLAGARAHGGGGGEQRRAGDVAAAGEDQDAALGLLVAVDDRRQRVGLERARSSGFAALHRVPAIASGAAVLRRAFVLERRAVVPQRQLRGRTGPPRRARNHKPRCRS